MTEVALDASALLALMQEEPGADKVRALMPHAVMSAVNFCETVQCLRRGGIPMEALQRGLKNLVPQPVPFDESMVWVAASLHERSRSFGLSFGDCACLALAMVRNIPAVTAEQIWEKADLGVEVVRIR